MNNARRRFSPLERPIRLPIQNFRDRRRPNKLNNPHLEGFSLNYDEKRKAVDGLLKSLGVPEGVRNDFSKAVLDTIEKQETLIAHARLPQAPIREYRPRENIIDYLRDPEGFGPWAQAGALTRPLIREKSPKAYMALANWLRTNELPADFHIPTKSEALANMPIDPNTVRAVHRTRRAAESERAKQQLELSPKSARNDFNETALGAIEQQGAIISRSQLPQFPIREYRPRESIIDYLRDPEGFGPWLDTGALTRPLIREKSPKAYMALANWLRKNELPSDLNIPKKSEILDLLVADREFVRTAQSVASAAYRRSLKAFNNI